MRLLELEPSVGLGDGIAGYLPSVWSDSDFIQTVTIHELLDHTSGVAGAGVPGFTANTYDSDYARSKDIGQTGLDPSDTVATGYAYSNANYGFLRLLIAGLEGASYTGTDSSDATNAIGAYATVIQCEVFDKAGPSNGAGGFVGITPSASPSVVQYYAWGTTLPGWSIGNRSDNLASGGYYFSVLDLAQLMAYLNHTTQILTWQSREALYDSFFGLTDGARAAQNPNGSHGWYYLKAGSLAN